MRKYAVVDDNTVVEVLNLDEDGYKHEASYHQLIIDIEDLLIQPTVGWKFVVNQLTPPPAAPVDLPTLIKAKIKSYQDKAPTILRDMYTANTLLGITIQQSDAMFADYQDVLIRLREGAWPTALYRLQQKTPSGFVTQPMIDNWIAVIQINL